MFTTPPDCLLTEGLAAALQRRDGRIIWVRLGPEDRDPATLLLSLIAAARHWQADFGRRTVELMREQPGPIAGWPLAFAQLTLELQGLLATSGALVLEDVHHLRRDSATLELLGFHLLPTRTRHVAYILTSSDELPAAALCSWTVRRSSRDLRLADATIVRLLTRVAPDVSGESLRQVIVLCQGRPALLDAACAAWVALGPAPVERAVGLSDDPEGFLTLLAGAWLTMVDARGRQALALALSLGYCHPALMSAAMGREGTLPAGPWLQKLDGGWLLVRTAWKAPLRSALGASGLPDHDAIHRAADYLLEVGAVEQAVQLYLEVKDTDGAAQAIAADADRLMDLGQWVTMGDWLRQLPDRTLKTRPWLVYHQAEIAASQGRLQTAQRCLSTATSLFIARDEPNGACHSMLAESTLAASRVDFPRAEAHALAASARADAAGLPWYQAWAAWQLGSLALNTEKLDNATINFVRAAEVAARIEAPPLLDLAQEAARLTGRLQAIRRRRQEFRAAYFGLEVAEHAASDRLVGHVGTAYEQATALIEAHGWSHMPLALKLPALRGQPQVPSTPNSTRWWSRVRHRFATGREPTSKATAPAQRKPAPTLALRAPVPSSVGRAHVPPAQRGSVGPARSEHAPAPGKLTTATSAERAGHQATTLTAHLLGPLRVAINDVPVENWPSGRSRVLFAYLLTHRDPWSPAEVLMEAFWSAATPEAARNNLHVTIHRLRRSLRTASDVRVVILDAGVYQLDQGLQLWVDLDEFDRHVRVGRQFEAAGDLAGAVSEYEFATLLYQGDFLAEDPYEEWPTPPRERLRLTWLDTVERLSRLYFGQGRYAACTALCQRIVEHDSCREDAHRGLMRSYSRQGQIQLAVRQYRICVEALHAELGVQPSPETIKLCDRIRRREPV